MTERAEFVEHMHKVQRFMDRLIMSAEEPVSERCYNTGLIQEPFDPKRHEDKYHAHRPCGGCDDCKPEESYTYPEDATHDERAGAFCRWFREEYTRRRGVPYIPTRMVEGADFDSAIRMAAALDDDTMKKAATFYLMIPSGNDRFVSSGARTVTKMLHLLPSILEDLK